MARNKENSLVPASLISHQIYFLRGTRVMMDADLARLYGVTTSVLNQAVNRNRDRFPEDFMFQLKPGEMESLRFQIGISKPKGRGGRRYLPLVFTEQGVAMLSSVLRSERAVQVNIAIMRAFVQLRQMLATHEELRAKLEEMERRYDAKFQIVFTAIKRMLEEPVTRKNPIGFHAAASKPKRHQSSRRHSGTN